MTQSIIPTLKGSVLKNKLRNSYVSKWYLQCMCANQCIYNAYMHSHILMHVLSPNQENIWIYRLYFFISIPTPQIPATDKHGEFTRVILQQAPFHRPFVAFERRHLGLSKQKSEEPAEMQWPGRNEICQKIKQPFGERVLKKTNQSQEGKYYGMLDWIKFRFAITTSPSTKQCWMYRSIHIVNLVHTNYIVSKIYSFKWFLSIYYTEKLLLQQWFSSSLFFPVMRFTPCCTSVAISEHWHPHVYVGNAK